MVDETGDRFDTTAKAINIALTLLPEFLLLLEERKQRSGMTTQQILESAGVRFSENELNLLADLARLTQTTETEEQ